MILSDTYIKMSLTTGVELNKRPYRYKGIPLQKALNKIYLVKSHGCSAILPLPKCLRGKRVALLLIPDHPKQNIEDK